jgi:hypothetical protein
VNGGLGCTLPKRTLADYYIRLQSNSPQYFQFGVSSASSVAFRIDQLASSYTPLAYTYPLQTAQFNR